MRGSAGYRPNRPGLGKFADPSCVIAGKIQKLLITVALPSTQYTYSSHTVLVYLIPRRSSKIPKELALKSCFNDDVPHCCDYCN